MIIYNERRLNVTEDRTLFVFENLNLTFEVLSSGAPGLSRAWLQNLGSFVSQRLPRPVLENSIFVLYMYGSVNECACVNQVNL